MSKVAIELRALLSQIEEKNARITEIADVCEKENRARTEAEDVEFRSLNQQKQILEMRVHSLSMPQTVAEERTIDQMFRDALKESIASGSKTAITLELRTSISAGTTADLAGTGIIPVAEKEMLNPLRAGLIWDKVGIRISTDRHMRWPKHSKAVATWAGEAETINPTSIDWDKVESVTKRCSIAIDATRQQLEESEGKVEAVITTEMPAAIVDKINEALFATDGTGRVIYGPFVGAGTTGKAKKVTFASTSVPTRAEILSMKSAIAKAGVSPSTCCWVMTEDMKAKLEDVKVDAGSGRFLVENDRMLGYPIYTTDFIGDKNIGFGDFSYQACGITGNSVIFDPYTLALSDASRFVKNSDVTFATLRYEAFVLGVCKATAG